MIDRSVAWRLLQLASRILLGLGTFLVVVGSLLPPEAMPAPAVFDKLAHALAYAMLAAAGTVGFPGHRRSLAIAAALVALGGGLELLQGYVPGRAPDPADFAANILGVVLGLVAAHAAFRLRRLDRIRTGPIGAPEQLSRRDECKRAHSRRDPGR